MSAVSEWIVREYLEALGCLVQQPRKYTVVARSKRPGEEMDLIAFNPHASGKPPSDKILWGAAEMRQVRAALIGVRGWHSERFTPGSLEFSPAIFRFAEDDVVRQAEHLLGAGPVTKILCVPGLSPDPELQRQALKMIREKGIDGVLSFRTILLELAEMVDTNRMYEKSDILQLLRILKSYGLLHSAQMDLFKTRGRRVRAATEKPGDAEVAAAEEEGAPDAEAPPGAPEEPPAPTVQEP